MLLVGQERIFAETGVFNFFGRYNKGAFGAWTCVLATAFSAGTVLLVERPIERLRSRVRARPIALASAPEPSQPAVRPIA